MSHPANSSPQESPSETSPASSGESPPKNPKHTLPDFTPVPRLKARSNGWNEDVQRRFIEALADTGSVTSACRAVGRSDQSAYALRRHPEGKSFRKAWQAALDCGIQRIEDVAMERALNGVEVPVYSYGQLVGTRRVYNDYLLMFMLRNRAPKRFNAARGLSAVDNAMLRRLKKQWHAEWEAARVKKEWEDEDAILDSLDAKIEAQRAREEAAKQLLDNARKEGLFGYEDEPAQEDQWVYRPYRSP